MPSKMPRQTIQIRRLPKVGDEITIRVRVTRVADDKLTVMNPDQWTADGGP